MSLRNSFKASDIIYNETNNELSEEETNNFIYKPVKNEINDTSTTLTTITSFTSSNSDNSLGYYKEINETFDEIGMSEFHIKILLLGFLSCFIDGSEIVVVNLIMRKLEN